MIRYLMAITGNSGLIAERSFDYWQKSVLCYLSSVEKNVRYQR